MPYVRRSDLPLRMEKPGGEGRRIIMASGAEAASNLHGGPLRRVGTGTKTIVRPPFGGKGKKKHGRQVKRPGDERE